MKRLSASVLLVLLVLLVAIAFWAIAFWPEGSARPGAARDHDPAAGATPGPLAEGPAVAESTGETRLERTEIPTSGVLAVRTFWRVDGQPAPFVPMGAQRDDEAAQPATAGETDANGHARFTNLVPGRYRVVLPRHAPPSEESKLVAEIVAGRETELRLFLGGDVTLRILVVDQKQAPVPGADVWCSDPLRPGQKTYVLGATDSAGSLRFRGLALHRVWARLRGYEPSHQHVLPFPDEKGRSAAHDIRLTLGGAACTVRGTVVDPEGQPAGKARVSIACDDSREPARRELTLDADAAGHFSCDEVPAGPRTVAASLPGCAPGFVRITTAPDVETIVEIAVRQGVHLSGRVARANGQPVANARLTATSSGSQQPGFAMPLGLVPDARSGPDGGYELDAIPAGTVLARAQLAPVIEREFLGADGDRLRWDPVEALDLSISGIVVDSEDRPLPGWGITCEGPRAAIARSATDENGSFRISGLVDSAHRVCVFAPLASGESRSSIAALVPRAVVNDVIPPADSLRIRVDDTAAASAWIEGTLLLPPGRTASARLGLNPKGMSGNSNVPRLRLAEGETTFRLGPLPAGEYDLLCIELGFEPIRRRALRVASGETLRLPPLDFATQRPLELVLTRLDGQMVTDAHVCLLPNTVCRETAPGRYVSPPVGEGPWNLSVRGPDVAPGKFRVARFVDGPTYLVVGIGTRINLRVKPPTPRPRWIGDIVLSVHDANGGLVLREAMRIDTGPEWRFAIGLGPGTYTVQAFSHDEGEARASVVVGQMPAEVELQLAK